MPRIIACVVIAIASLPVAAQDWTKESKDRGKRAALHDAGQRVRGDSGKWNDDAGIIPVPTFDAKAKISLDAWADQHAKTKPKLTDKDEHWLILRTDQLDDNDRVWIERIERRGNKINIVANKAKWKGKYFRNFSYYQVIGINLGKLQPGMYDVQWILQPLTFTKFDGDGKMLDTNWPMDERPVDKKPTEVRITLSVSKAI
ncbi:MAG: hypothetical protein FJ303_10100 [Planctomycetes bacterium]|nr:hypothetical protein [Planctomycetota bacterium]